MTRYFLASIAASAVAGIALLAVPAAKAQDDMTGVSLSGSMTEDIGFGSWIGGSRSNDDMHMQTDATLTFTASGVTDGGLTVTAKVDMDADSSGGIEESTLAIAGAFGQIILGADDNAGNILGNVGIGNSYAGTGYYDGDENYTPASSPSPIPNSDGLGIRYITPNISGFQAGVSFQPQHGDDNVDGSTTVANDATVFAIGANFTGDFGGTSLTVGGNYVSEKILKTPNDKADYIRASWGLGTSFGIGTTTLSVRYDVKSNTHPNRSIIPTLVEDYEDTSSYGIGIDHVIGDLAFGVGYGVSTAENWYGETITVPIITQEQANDPTFFVAGKRAIEGDPNARSATFTFVDSENAVISAGAKYDLGGGVSIHLAVTSGTTHSADFSQTTTGKCTTPENKYASTGTRTGNYTGLGCYAPDSFDDDGVLTDNSTRVPGDLVFVYQYVLHQGD